MMQYYLCLYKKEIRIQRGKEGRSWDGREMTTICKPGRKVSEGTKFVLGLLISRTGRKLISV
jgi:hypothetical protein